MDLLNRLNTTEFLGKEFLTWLWYRSDVQEGLLEVGDGGPAVELSLCDRIVLSGAGKGAEKVAIRTEEPSVNPEARVALRQGKKVEQGRIQIVRDQREWTFTIRGETLALGSIKIPAVLTRDEDDRLRERLALLDQLDGMITALFLSFVRLRTRPAEWAEEQKRIEDWIAGDGPDRLSEAARAADLV